MFRFIVQTLVMIVLAFLVYLLAEALPRVTDEEIDVLRARRSSRLVGYVERSDEALKSFTEKFLRKAKVWLLQLNNFIEAKLSKFKKDNGKTTTLPEQEEKKEE